MKIFLLIFAIVLTHFRGFVSVGPGGSSPPQAEQSYVVFSEDVEALPGDLQTLIEFDNLMLIDRERLLNGSMNILEDMNNDEFKFTVELFSSPHGDGDYKKMAMDVPPTGVCEGFKKFYVQFVQPSLIFGENSDFPFVPDDGLCPIPAGTYFLNSIEFNTRDWPNQVPRGLVKCVVTFTKNDAKVGGIAYIIQVKDRDS